MSENADHRLMLAVKNGEIRKLGELFERHHLHLYNFFLQLTGIREASEDLVQDVFFRILKYRHTYREEGSFKAWMFTIARNAHIDFMNAQRYPMESDSRKIIDTTGDDNPAQQAEARDQAALMQLALSRLPEEKRTVLLLSKYQEMRYSEIGEIMKCSENSVKVKVYRALKNLSQIYFQLSGEKKDEL